MEYSKNHSFQGFCYCIFQKENTSSLPFGAFNLKMNYCRGLEFQISYRRLEFQISLLVKKAVLQKSVRGLKCLYYAN